MNKEKRRVPKLRFPGFTEDWEQRKLGECMNSFAYGLNAAAKDYDGMHKYIRITDIDDETHNFIQSNLTSPDIDFNMDVSDYKLNVGDIVFARTGASVGKTYLYNPNDGDLYYAGFLIRGEVKEDCDAGFIYQNTLTKEYDSFIRITSQRSGQPGVNSKEYATFKLNIPCKDEQEKISKVLNSLDELYTLHQRKLEHLILKKKALLQKLFPKNGERYPELRFSEFTDAWEQRKFKDLFIERREKTIRENEETLLSCAITGIYLNSELFSHFRGSSTIGYLKIKKYDLILSAQNLHLGNANINLSFDKGMISPAYKVFELKSIDPYFINAWVKKDSTKNFFLKATTEGASQCRKNIEWDVLLNQEIPVPNKLEQRTIGRFINNIDMIITLHQRKLEHLQLQKKALLQQMFV